LKGERFGLLTRMATESVSSCTPTKSSERFWNWKERFVSTYCANNADAHRDNRKRFVVHADEKLTALWEMESEIRSCGLKASKNGTGNC
jgi:hypothetical protein